MDKQPLSPEQYEALKKSLDSSQLYALSQAERACEDLTLDYFEVYRRSYEWMVGKHLTPKNIAKSATLGKLIQEVLRRAAKLRGVKFSK